LDCCRKYRILAPKPSKNWLMRVLTIQALALALAGCNGDRLKQSTNGRQAQPQSKSIAHLNGGSIADGDPQAA
jgi:hypothetical protein